MDKITICDLEVFYQVGVTDQERARPQRLLITVELDCEFAGAAAQDDLGQTIDYFAVSQRLLRFGEGSQWQLIETLATDLAAMVLENFKPRAVTVGIKKFAIPQARYVSVWLHRQRG